jgi:hypothetical protein
MRVLTHIERMRVTRPGLGVVSPDLVRTAGLEPAREVTPEGF